MLGLGAVVHFAGTSHARSPAAVGVGVAVGVAVAVVVAAAVAVGVVVAVVVVVVVVVLALAGSLGLEQATRSTVRTAAWIFMADAGSRERRMKRHAPATLRNREPILAELLRFLPKTGTVLELASGSGEHAAFFAAHIPGLTWQPSDADEDARASIEAYRAEVALTNLRAPLAVDARDDAATWGLARADALVCINMIHIAPWASCEGLMRGAGRLLSPGGVLFLYGPFTQGGVHTAPSNATFDLGLRARDPSWGVRDLEDVTREAERAGLARTAVVRMPANNLSVVFARRA